MNASDFFCQVAGDERRMMIAQLNGAKKQSGRLA